MDHDKVQLWKGGPYWATTNIGADGPEEAGLYFMWGNTVGYKLIDGVWTTPDGCVLKDGFCAQNCIMTGMDADELVAGGVIGAAGFLSPLHDAASVNWGAEWRMPSVLELEMLSDRCFWTWRCLNGVDGYEVRGKGGFANSNIFLPSAGYGDGPALCNYGSYGTYWSSAPHSNSISSRYLGFRSGGHYTNGYAYRLYGFSVRPVHGCIK